MRTGRADASRVRIGPTPLVPAVRACQNGRQVLADRGDDADTGDDDPAGGEDRHAATTNQESGVKAHHDKIQGDCDS